MTHTQNAIRSLNTEVLDLPVQVLTAAQKDATEAQILRAILDEVRATTPSSRTKALLDKRIPQFENLRAENGASMVPDTIPTHF